MTAITRGDKTAAQKQTTPTATNQAQPQHDEQPPMDEQPPIDDAPPIESDIINEDGEIIEHEAAASHVEESEAMDTSELAEVLEGVGVRNMPAFFGNASVSTIAGEYIKVRPLSIQGDAKGQHLHRMLKTFSSLERELKPSAQQATALRDAFRDCCLTGIVPDGKMAAVFPQKGNKGIATLQIMTRGWEYMANRHAGVIVNSGVVHEHDDFMMDIANNTIHCRITGKRGEVMGTFAIAKDLAGNVLYIEYEEWDKTMVWAKKAKGNQSSHYSDDHPEAFARNRLTKRVLSRSMGFIEAQTANDLDPTVISKAMKIVSNADEKTAIA